VQRHAQKIGRQIVAEPLIVLAQKLDVSGADLFSSSRQAACWGVSSPSMPPCGICQPSIVWSMRRPTNTSPSRLKSITPTQGR